MRNTLSTCLEFQASKNPDKEAIVYKNKRFSYAVFNKAVNKTATLLANLGLEKNDRVAVYLEKCPQEAFSIYGINRSGGIFIDINHMLKAPQVEHILLDSGARFLFTTHQRLKFLKPVLSSCSAIEGIVLFGSGDIKMNPPLTVIEFDKYVADTSYTSPCIVETDLGAIIYTSGSTGKPKGVILSQRNLVAGAESVSTYLENNENDRILSVLPFSFDYGLNQLTCSIYSGATCVLMNYLFPNDIIKMMDKESITGLGLIPPLWLQLLQKDWNGTQFPNWRYMTNTGGRLPEAAVKEYRLRLPKTRIYLMYGLTEAFRGTYLPPDEVDRRPNSVGKAIPNAEIFLINEKGKRCKPGEEGELVQRGAHVALGYWNNPEKTAKSFRPNPFSLQETQFTEYVVYSGDRFVSDNKGYLYFVNREDEMIKTSGYRVSPSEVEEALYATGLVEHVVVFGIPDDILGESVVAVVSTANKIDATPHKLQIACGERLAGYMVPKKIIIWDSLPLNSNGKLDRPRIKNMIVIEEKQS